MLENRQKKLMKFLWVQVFFELLSDNTFGQRLHIDIFFIINIEYLYILTIFQY